MPAVVEVEAGGTARIECSFYTPENGSSTSISWFYVSVAWERSSGLGPQQARGSHQHSLGPSPCRWTATAG